MKEKILSEIKAAVKEANATIVPSNGDSVYISVNEYTSYGDFVISDNGYELAIYFKNNVVSSFFNKDTVEYDFIHDGLISIIERLKDWLDKYIMVINGVSDELQDHDISYINDFKSGVYFFKNNSTGKIVCCEPIVNIDDNIDNEIIKISIIGSGHTVTECYEDATKQDDNCEGTVFAVTEDIKFFLL